MMMFMELYVCGRYGKRVNNVRDMQQQAHQTS